MPEPWCVSSLVRWTAATSCHGRLTQSLTNLRLDKELDDEVEEVDEVDEVDASEAPRERGGEVYESLVS